METAVAITAPLPLVTPEARFVFFMVPQIVGSVKEVPQLYAEYTKKDTPEEIKRVYISVREISQEEMFKLSEQDNVADLAKRMYDYLKKHFGKNYVFDKELLDSQLEMLVWENSFPNLEKESQSVVARDMERKTMSMTMDLTPQLIAILVHPDQNWNNMPETTVCTGKVNFLGIDYLIQVIHVARNNVTSEDFKLFVTPTMVAEAIEHLWEQLFSDVNVIIDGQKYSALQNVKIDPIAQLNKEEEVKTDAA